MSEYTLAGGPSSLAARFDDMELWADRLGAEAERLRNVVAGALLDDVADTGGRVVGALLAPSTAAEVEAALSEFRTEAAAATTAMTVVAEGLPLAITAYRGAEDAADGAFRAILGGAGYGVGILTRGVGIVVLFSPSAWMTLGFGAAVINVALTDEQRKALGSAAAKAAFDHSDEVGLAIDTMLPGFLAGLFGLPFPGVPFPGQPAWPSDTESLARVLVGLGLPFGALQRREFEVEEVDRSDTRHAQPPKDPQELFARTADQHQGKESGEVRIEEVIGPDGERRWIVYLPATTDWTLDGENITDSTTNGRGVAGLDTDMRQMVMEAMAEQGIAPGEEVMLTGYSQGGITAAGLASDPSFTSRYNVTAVVTSGSPVSGFDIPPEVDMLSLEREKDLVPDLDGKQNPEQANWTTVTAEMSMEDLREMPMFEGKSDEEIRRTMAEPGFSHSVALYEETWRQLSGTGEVGRFQAEHAGFFAGTVVGSRDYAATRVPEGRRRKKP